MRANPTLHARQHRSQTARSLQPPFQSPQPRLPGAPSPSSELVHAPQMQVSSSTSPLTHPATSLQHAVVPASHCSRTQPRVTASLEHTTASPEHSSAARQQHHSTSRQHCSFARAEHRATHRVTQLTLTLCRQVAACSLRACRRPHACKSHRRPAQATSTHRFCR